MAGVLFAGTGLFAADGNSTHATGVSSARQPLAITNCCGNSTNAVDNTTPTNATTTPTAVYVPDLSHANGPLPDGILAWDELLKSVDVPASQSQAHFVFNVTNISPDNVVVLGAHGSCSCTVTELPPLPWTIPPGGHGQVGAVVNLEGKSGVLFKAVTVSTDKGSKDLYLKITILPPVIPTLTDAERTNGVMVARADRQAIFKADCATCHAKPGEGKYGKALRRRLRHLPRSEQPRRSGAGFAQPENADQRRILAHVDRPRQGRLAHARLLHRRRRPAQRHANRHGGRLSENGDPLATLAGKLTPGSAGVLRLRKNFRAVCCQP